jgi:signal peptidase I
MESKNSSSFTRDAINIVVFVVLVVLGAVFINTFIFRSFSVTGPSMETTLFTDDRLIVNKIPVTWERLLGKKYIPGRGEIIVFQNPYYQAGRQDEFIVKRVIGFPGERVVVKDGTITVYNSKHPKGFQPDKAFGGEPGSPTSGDADKIVPEGEIFVAGDHRQGNYSLDSRNGLGTIPLYDIVGPVGIRIYPFDKIRFF